MNDRINVEEVAHRVALCLTGEGMPFHLEDRSKGFEEADRVTFAKIRREDGAGVCFHLVTYPGPRIHLSGEWPRQGATCYLYGKYQQSPKISVSPDRPPDAIAREIKRRLLPFYLPLYAEAVQDKAADERRREDAHNLAVRLGGILSASPRGLEDTREEITIYADTKAPGAHVVVKINRGGGLRFEIDPGDDPQSAHSLAAWIKAALQ